MKPSEILLMATDLISDRGQQYGHHKIMFARMASRFTNTIDFPIEDYQAALLMVELKLARIQESPRTHLDSWLDAIAYLALGASLAMDEDELYV